AAQLAAHGNLTRHPPSSRWDHQPLTIKRRTRPMMGFKTFRCARIILGGIETMHMIRKGQMSGCDKARSPAQQFNSLFV
ncbi:transposase, partial [Robbsia andropogonis]|nr:transposase [Robbsia andropogonis]MCP1131488.1 transposase [Robbsia andropogonis]